MPKDTFFNLKSEKRAAITQAFLEEFCHKSYEEASISAVVKALGIAKGSIYQYFSDKLDLYLYLKSTCEQIKLSYIAKCQRSDFPDFWQYFRQMYQEGVVFYLQEPLASRFLNAVSKNVNSPTLAPYINAWRDQAFQFFEQLIKAEVKAGHFREDVPIKTMAFFLVSNSMNIGEYMEVIHDLDFNKEFEKRPANFTRQKKVLLRSVDEMILLLQKAFDK